METGGVGVARRVDQNNICPLLPRLLHKVGELRCSGTDDRRAFGGAAVAPFGGGGLRVNVEQGHSLPVTCSTDSKMSPSCCWARAEWSNTYGYLSPYDRDRCVLSYYRETC